MKTMQSTDTGWQHRVQKASVPLSVSNQNFGTGTIGDIVNDLDTVPNFSSGQLDQRSLSCKKITGP